MKKALVLVMLAGLFVGSCFAQQGGNVEKGIIGTWTNEEGAPRETWVFSADGKVTIDGKLGKFGVTNGMLAIGGIRFCNDCGAFQRWDASISSDGKTLILNGDRSWWWLTKR